MIRLRCEELPKHVRALVPTSKPLQLLVGSKKGVVDDLLGGGAQSLDVASLSADPSTEPGASAPEVPMEERFFRIGHRS